MSIAHTHVMKQVLFPDFQEETQDSQSNRTNQAKPFLKWVGGKGQLLSQFEPLFPKTFSHYYEPFVGSGAVFFYLQPTVSTTLNDSNPNLITTYRHIQQHLDDLLSILYRIRNEYHALTPEQQEQKYYQVRDRYNALPIGSLDKSALLIFLNKTGYNGLYRESKRGGYNVPFGRYDNPALFDETNLRAVSKALQHVEILNGNFCQAVESAKSGDFAYFDPPYMPISKTSSFTSYTQSNFDVDQQVHLAEVARQLANRGVQVMLSNSDNEFIRSIYKDFELHEVRASRAVNSKPDLRGKITELVITSYKV